jgi:O-acetylhomoserine aminocarboxypropyltransferase
VKKDLIKCGVLPEAVRINVGIENINDIIADIEQALAKL